MQLLPTHVLHALVYGFAVNGFVYRTELSKSQVVQMEYEAEWGSIWVDMFSGDSEAVAKVYVYRNDFGQVDLGKTLMQVPAKQFVFEVAYECEDIPKQVASWVADLVGGKSQ